MQSKHKFKPKTKKTKDLKEKARQLESEEKARQLELEEKAHQLDEKIWFSHYTSILPTQNGVMLPGNLISNLESQGLSPLALHQRTLKVIPSIRMTIHWYPQALVIPHISYKPIENTNFVIIERAAYLKSRLFGGYSEDFWIVGPYQLSRESIILVPESKINEAKKTLKGFRGELRTYKESDNLEQVVTDIIQKKSNLSIKVEPNQKYTEDYSASELLEIIHANPGDPECKQYEEPAKKALAQGIDSIEIELPCPADKIKITVNEKTTMLNHDFYSGWYAQRLYNKFHAQSIFFDLEKAIKEIIPPLIYFYKFKFQKSQQAEEAEFFSNMSKIMMETSSPLSRDKISKVRDKVKEIKNERLKQKSEFLSNISKFIMATCSPDKISNVRDKLKEIKKELLERKFPEDVLNYFQDEWEVNFEMRLNLLEELYFLTKSNKLTMELLESKIDATAQKVGASQTKETVDVDIPNYPITSKLKDEFGIKPRIELRKESGFVDIIWETSRPLGFQYAYSLHEKLNKKGIFNDFVIYPEKVFESKLVIFKANTREVNAKLMEVMEDIKSEYKSPYALD